MDSLTQKLCVYGSAECDQFEIEDKPDTFEFKRP